jgi:ribonuclease P protein component
LGNAALRNRARRVLKELIRTHPHPAMEGKDIIILYRQRIDLETMNKAGEELGRLLDRLAGEQ